MKLTEHFTLEELIFSETAIRHGLDNTPNEDVIDNLRLLASHLEEVRSLLGVPIIISSGYRCPALNRAVGSKDTSAHVQGLAADFTAPAFGSPLKICQEIRDCSAIRFDQLIHEFGTWVHFGVAVAPRRELLTIDQDGTRSGLLSVRMVA